MDDKVAAYLAEAEERWSKAEYVGLKDWVVPEPGPQLRYLPDVHRLIKAVRAGLAEHQAFGIYDECGHDHEDSEPGSGDLIRVDEVGLVCADGFQYRICKACCTSGPPNWYQTEECVSSHGHGRDEPWCRTHEAMSSALLGEVPEDASL